MGSQKGGEWKHERGTIHDAMGQVFINKGIYENPNDPKMREWQRQRNSKFGLGNYAPGGYFSPEKVAERKNREEEDKKWTAGLQRFASIPETTEGRRGFLNTEREGREEIWDGPFSRGKKAPIHDFLERTGQVK